VMTAVAWCRSRVEDASLVQIARLDGPLLTPSRPENKTAGNERD
jgi:hypothetical protein